MDHLMEENKSLDEPKNVVLSVLNVMTDSWFKYCEELETKITEMEVKLRDFEVQLALNAKMA